MVFMQDGFSLGQQVERRGAFKLVERHAAVRFSLNVGKIFRVGLLGYGIKGLVGAGQVAFADVGRGQLQ